MPASEPFTGLYSQRTREALRCLSDHQRVLFMMLALYAGPNGSCRPGVRELHDFTGYHTKLISDVLEQLQEKDLIVIARKNARDELTGQILPDVYAVNPALLVVTDPSFWHEIRFRHASMPESLSSVKTAQAEQSRINEAESVKQNQRSRITAPEGAAKLPPDRVATRKRAKPSGENAGAGSTAGSQRQPNSMPQAGTPPGSAPPPSTRELSFNEKLATEAIRRQVGDMSHEKAAQLVVTYGIDKFNAAVLAMKERDKKVPIPRPTGWIIRKLEAGAKRA